MIVVLVRSMSKQHLGKTGKPEPADEPSFTSAKTPIIPKTSYPFNPPYVETLQSEGLQAGGQTLAQMIIIMEKVELSP